MWRPRFRSVACNIRSARWPKLYRREDWISANAAKMRQPYLHGSLPFPARRQTVSGGNCASQRQRYVRKQSAEAAAAGTFLAVRCLFGSLHTSFRRSSRDADCPAQRACGAAVAVARRRRRLLTLRGMLWITQSQNARFVRYAVSTRFAAQDGSWWLRTGGSTVSRSYRGILRWRVKKI